MIPKIIHQVYLSEGPLREDFERNRQSWLKLHPGWEYHLWRSDNLPPLINQKLFDGEPLWVVQGDLVRLELVYRFGGVYADLDTEALKPLDPLLGLEELLVMEQPDNWIVGNAFVGARPGHPFLRQALDAVGKSVAEHDSVLDKAGPFFLTRQIKKYNEGNFPLNILPGGLFFPYLWHQREKAAGPFPDAYAVHRWACSWR